MGYTESCKQVRGPLPNLFLDLFCCACSSEYITIVSIIVVMTVWDFVIGVLFGIVVSCEPYSHCSHTYWRSSFDSRFLFCRPKFSAVKHSCFPYRGDGHVHRASAKLTTCVYSGGLEADDDSPPARFDFLLPAALAFI